MVTRRVEERMREAGGLIARGRLGESPRCLLCGEGDLEDGAAGGGAEEIDVAAVGFYDVFGDGEAEAGAGWA